jgi:hypothetical protein
MIILLVNLMLLHDDLDVLFADINCYLLLKIRYNKIKLLIHANI